MKSLERKILLPGNRHFPACLPDYCPRHLVVIGSPALFSQTKVAVFASAHCPGELLSKGYDFAQVLRRYQIPVISGFHSPLEKEMLRIFLNGSQSVIKGYARNINHLRIPRSFRAPLKTQRMLLFSSFLETEFRSTQKTAIKRNQMIAAMADLIIIVSASAGGKLERLALDFKTQGKQILTIKSQYNVHLEQHGIEGIKNGHLDIWLKETGFTLKTDLNNLPGFFGSATI